MNQLVGEKLSIVTPKAQTTRHRILGIVSEENYQLVFSDTPGYLESRYGLHRSMMRFVESAIEDADIILWVIDVTDEGDVEEYKVQIVQAPRLIILLNKVDKLKGTSEAALVDRWKAEVPHAVVLPIAAESGYNVGGLMGHILQMLPESPPFYDKDELTDKSERFLAAEMIREKIFLNYRQEIPYACEVAVDSFKEEAELLRISALVYVERASQKGIVIGPKGAGLKKVGTEARKDLEAFFGKQVMLSLFVKVKENWRNDDRMLRYFGYNH